MLEEAEEALNCNAHMSVGDLASARAEWFSKWVARSAQLKSRENAFKSSMPNHFRKILNDKKLVLLSEILKEKGYPDLGVCQEISLGSSNKSISRSVRSSGDDGLDQEVFKKNVEESDAGWLRGEKAAWPKCQTGVFSDAKVSSSCAATDGRHAFWIFLAKVRYQTRMCHIEILESSVPRGFSAQASASHGRATMCHLSAPRV